MKGIVQIGLLLWVLAPGAVAGQRGVIVGGGSRGGFAGRGFPSGFVGSVPFPGSPRSSGNVALPRLGAIPPAAHRLFGAPGVFRSFRFRGLGASPVVPFLVPLFVGGYSYPSPETPNVIVIYACPEQTPAEVVNEEMPDPPLATETPAVYLVALKDRSVSRAVAHWTDDGTLHFVTTEGKHTQVSLDWLDRESTERLNRED